MRCDRFITQAWIFALPPYDSSLVHRLPHLVGRSMPSQGMRAGLVLIQGRPDHGRLDSVSWRDKYQNKVVSAERALKAISSGDHVYIHSGCAEPEILVKALIARAGALRGVRIFHLLTVGNADYVQPNTLIVFATWPFSSVQILVRRCKTDVPTMCRCSCRMFQGS